MDKNGKINELIKPIIIALSISALSYFSSLVFSLKERLDRNVAQMVKIETIASDIKDHELRIRELERSIAELQALYVSRNARLSKGAEKDCKTISDCLRHTINNSFDN